TFFLPETPRFLLYQGKLKIGKGVLKRIESVDIVDKTISKIKDQKNIESNTYKIWNPITRKILYIVIGVMFIQQFVGINTIIYFTPSLFANFNGNLSSTGISFSIGIINVLSSIFAILLLDRIGRRRLFFIGLFGMFFSLVILGFVFISNSYLSSSVQWLTLFVVLLYIMFFAISLGPISWLLFAEIFPLKVRGIGMSIGAFSNWLFNAILTIGILKLTWLFKNPNDLTEVSNKTLSNYGQLFFVFAAIAIFGILWGKKHIPETMGHTLEEIEDLWYKGKKPIDF
ncbi:MAG: MFS transporter, partial [Salinivirgaceae bacterium]|nr:MFS transporter [Salinivirgaceae bacterium]